MQQRLFLRTFVGTSVDLIVLGLFVEHGSLVVIDSFSVTVLTAALLQVALKLTLWAERRIGRAFAGRDLAHAKAERILSTWALLVGSKLLILGLIDVVFQEAVSFRGPLHGLVAFLVVVTTMLLGESIALWLYKKLG
ncbi:MAG: hypothetical protein AAGI22_29340 [Planctomycetota bacterium]